MSAKFAKSAKNEKDGVGNLSKFTDHSLNPKNPFGKFWERAGFIRIDLCFWGQCFTSARFFTCSSSRIPWKIIS